MEQVVGSEAAINDVLQFRTITGGMTLFVIEFPRPIRVSFHNLHATGSDGRFGWVGTLLLTF